MCTSTGGLPATSVTAPSLGPNVDIPSKESCRLEALYLHTWSPVCPCLLLDLRPDKLHLSSARRPVVGRALNKPTPVSLLPYSTDCSCPGVPNRLYGVLVIVVR